MPTLPNNGDRVPDSAIVSATRIRTTLRGDILTGRLRPGTKVNVEDLAERYETSHIPIREALIGLVSEGLVKREERRGFFVAAFTAEVLEELIKTRCWLEERALTESIANRTVKWEEDLVLALHWLSRTDRYTDAARQQLNPGWEERHKQFHQVLISACGSSLLLRYCQEVRDRVDSYRFITESANPAPFEARPDEHRLIADAALAGDTSTAVELLMQHYRQTLEIITATFAAARPERDAAGSGEERMEAMKGGA
ncbi:hypothetical protein VW23_001995 [Devosia insulae DS-56]|uniref:HTH gntR-type domain-containing protein n=1 Tax=Devosia insulae DS-56 TaxID=1116389 RepID=A0A1E5XM88_9HYPH|nr:GntR family transcriptional regulator [Devosia insulae]OEO29685.1 hypothetical protein VW23_001995 [Devosia insulae DS-56]